MPVLCSRGSKVKEPRRPSTPTLTDARKAELQQRRRRELNSGPMPVVDTRAISSAPQQVTSPCTTSSVARGTPNSTNSPTAAPAAAATTTPPHVEHRAAATATADDSNATELPNWGEHRNTLLASSSSFMCCSMRVADQPEDIGYYIYPLAVNEEAQQPQHHQKVKICSTSPPRRTKPLEANRPAPIFVPYEEY